MAMTNGQKNKKIRQEALREQLAAQGHVQHVIDIADKLQEPLEELNKDDITRLKAAADIKLKLINKYLPDLKAIEIEGEVDSTLTIIRKEYKPSTS